MIKSNTYIVCNSSTVARLKQIQHFKVNLGQALIDRSMNFNPTDMSIQKHYIFHNDIINLVGFIGALAVYTKTNSEVDHIYLYNEKESFDYTLDGNMSLYDNINTSLGLFFEKIGIKNTVSTVNPEPIKEPEYVKPAKKMSEMTEAERIAYARNLK